MDCFPIRARRSYSQNKISRADKTKRVLVTDGVEGSHRAEADVVKRAHGQMEWTWRLG